MLGTQKTKAPLARGFSSLAVGAPAECVGRFQSTRKLRVTLRPSRNRHGHRLRFLAPSSLNARSLPLQIAQIIQPSSPNLTLAHYLNRADRRRVQRENA